jgi:hypothetical protein
VRKLVARGVVTLPVRTTVSRFEAMRSRGASVSAAVSRDRDERGEFASSGRPLSSGATFASGRAPRILDVTRAERLAITTKRAK